MTGKLWQITAPHFVAGLIVSSGKVTHSAPILHWTVGKEWSWVKQYCVSKGWHGCCLDKGIDNVSKPIKN